MKKKLVPVLLLLLAYSFSYCQPDQSGDYGVGFKYFKTTDPSRKYILGTDTVDRPMLIHFWYPAKKNSNLQPMTFKDYIDLIAIREDFNKNQQEINGFSESFIRAYLGFAKQKFGIDTTVTTKEVFNSRVRAIYKAKPVNGKFPLIIYAPSNSKSSVQNHILCEELARRGYFVVSVGSAGAETLKRKNEIKAALAQVHDMEFIVKFIEDSLKIKYAGVGLLGFSSGGMATVIYQMRHPEVKAMVSLDGSQEYGLYLILHQFEDFDPAKAVMPYLLLANNYKDFSFYPYYSSIASGNKYLYKMSYLGHNGFISYWTQFDRCSKEKHHNAISDSYELVCLAVNAFFDNTVKSDRLKPKGFEIPNSPLIQQDTVDYSVITGLLNHLLNNGVENALAEIRSHETLYQDKRMNLLGKMLIGYNAQMALKIFAVNLEIHPNSWESYLYLAFLYLRSNEVDAAKAAILKAKSLNPANGDVQALYDEIMKVTTK
ncbi:MAG: hypothetical protein JXR71_01555 [Bacteroidales bacterium]|nr:hypothetical protein [Bacteroidales bacterium]